MTMQTDPDPDPDLAKALAAVRRPVESGPLPSAPLRLRLGTTLWLRRLLPTAIMVRRAERRGRAIWEQYAEERGRARAAMEAIVAGTPRAHEVEMLAREHVVEGNVKETLFWQPWGTAAVDETSAARLREALDAGRGVILSACHMGPYILCASVATAVGRTPYSVSGWGFQTPSPGYWGRRIMRRRAEALARGERLVPAAGSFPLLKKLLEDREIVIVFFSMPGSQETRFLGKPAMLASGSARLAVQADALIVPLRARRAGHRVWVDVGVPLDPRGYPGWEELHAALATVHERWILELPASMEDPKREGAWEEGAGPQAWMRPEPGTGP
jgi:lauroyl/myristoyl acyltransferase